MELPISWTEIIAAVIIILGGGGAVTWKKLGMVVTRKHKICPAPQGPPECPDPKCQSQVELTAKDVKDLRNDLANKIWPAIDESGKAIARIDERTVLMLEAMKK